MNNSAAYMHIPDLLKPQSWLANVWEIAANSHYDKRKQNYIGRFAPSPSGLLHQGSLVAALASFIHALWHNGEWLVRIEDVDHSRCRDEYAHHQLATLYGLGFKFPTPVWQRDREHLYQAAFNTLKSQQLIYPCTCSRKEITDSSPNSSTETIYSGQCRDGCDPHKSIRSWRFKVPNQPVHWSDEHGNTYTEYLTETTGDFVMRRADGDWAYQLAVVIDDAEQGITHVVRGEDLFSSTARQIAIQQSLDLPTPIYNHVPLLLGSTGEKLSKRGQAPALDVLHGLAALQHAWTFLGGDIFPAHDIKDFWQKIYQLKPSINGALSKHVHE